MADNFTVLNSAGATVTFRSTDNGSGVQVNMSIPSNPSGTALLGQFAMATSIPVAIASDQSIFTVKAIEAGTWTVQALQSGAPWSENITQVGGIAIALGSATGASSFPVVIASNQATLTTVLAAGSQAVGTVTAIQGGVWTTQVAGSLTVTSNSTQPLAIASVSTNPPTPVAVKNNTGTLVGINVYNTNSSYPVFLKIFNVTAGSFTSGSINAGTFSATFCCGIPPGSSRDVALPLGTNLTTAIAYYITKFAAANDTTSVATNDLVGMITYF